MKSVRGVTGQMQEPEDDVTGVAALKRAGLVVSFLLDEARLVCGAALCISRDDKIQHGRSYYWEILSMITSTTFYNMLLSGYHVT